MSELTQAMSVLPVEQRSVVRHAAADLQEEFRGIFGVETIVFLCVQNAGRSQMAAGWATSLGGNRIDVFSGGSDPASEVNPSAVAAMSEVGIDIADQFPKPWTDEVIRAADFIVTMGCGDACPVFPGKRYEDWDVPDPAGLDVSGVRPIRDEIELRVKQLLDQLASSRSDHGGARRRADGQSTNL